MSPARFADEIGVQRSSISHIISGRNKPSYDFIMKILDRFKGINAEWLLTGVGSMIKGQQTPENTEQIPQSLFDQRAEKNTENTDRPTTGNKNKEKDTDQIHVEEKQQASSLEQNKKNIPFSRFTNVNEVEYILTFYKDGSFKQFLPR